MSRLSVYGDCYAVAKIPKRGVEDRKENRCSANYACFANRFGSTLKPIGVLHSPPHTNIPHPKSAMQTFSILRS